MGSNPTSGTTNMEFTKLFDHHYTAGAKLVNPGMDLATAKQYLIDHGFSSTGGEGLAKFNQFAQNQINTDHTYAGKSVEFGDGGRSALLKHRLMMSGKYGKTVDEITEQDWEDILTVVRINYFRQIQS